MSFVERDVAGYQGQDIEVWVSREIKTMNVETPIWEQLRGVQNFTPTEERAETRVSEMGFDVSKVVYGATTYSISATMMVRDLVQIARLSGIDPKTAKRLVLTEFGMTNCLCWIKDPVTKTIVQTMCVSGFLPRTSSKALAVDANATITLEGKADMIMMLEGKCTMREHQVTADGASLFLITDTDIGDARVLAVENPAGRLLKLWDGYTYVVSAGKSYIRFEAHRIPEKGSKVRIAYSLS